MNLYEERYYIFLVLRVISLITNMICSIIFIKILRTTRNQGSNQMFKYLLIKSICDMLPGIFNLLEPFYKYSITASTQIYLMQVWFIWFNQYLSNVLYMASGLFEIAASFDCAISIENNLRWCRKQISFIIIVLMIFIFCASTLSYRVFCWRIIKNIYNEIGVNGKETEYFDYHVVHLIKFRKLVLKLEAAEIYIRNFAILIILIIINIFIIFKMVQIRKRKTQLQSTRNANVIAAERAENRKIKMITFLFILFMLGHFPLTLNYIFFSEFEFIRDMICEICFYISYSTPLIAYYLFNQKFKHFLSKAFKINIFNNRS
jgi:hypothetical protein